MKPAFINILLYFVEAIDEMRHMLFVEMDDGYEPCGNLYADISKETFKFAGILLASLIWMGGPAPNFFHLGYLNLCFMVVQVFWKVYQRLWLVIL